MWRVEHKLFLSWWAFCSSIKIMQYSLENTRFKIMPVSVRCLNEFGKSYTIHIQYFLTKIGPAPVKHRYIVPPVFPSLHQIVIKCKKKHPKILSKPKTCRSSYLISYQLSRDCLCWELTPQLFQQLSPQPEEISKELYSIVKKMHLPEDSLSSEHRRFSPWMMMDWKPLGNQTELRLITWITLLQLTRGFVVKLYKAPNLDKKLATTSPFFCKNLLFSKTSRAWHCNGWFSLSQCLTSRRDQTPAWATE